MFSQDTSRVAPEAHISIRTRPTLTARVSRKTIAEFEETDDALVYSSGLAAMGGAIQGLASGYHIVLYSESLRPNALVPQARDAIIW